MKLLILAFAFMLAVPFTTSAEPLPSPGIEVVATGCSPCVTGDRAVFVLNIVNPGPERGVQVVALLRWPSGAVLPLAPYDGTVMLLPPGASALTLAAFTVRGGDPGAYLVEAALVDPQTGVTLARHVIAAVRQ